MPTPASRPTTEQPATQPTLGRLLATFASGAALSRQDVISITGWSRSTVSTRTQQLVDAEWIAVADRVAPGPTGRPIERLALVPTRTVFLVLDYDERTLTASLLTLNGSVLAEHRTTAHVLDNAADGAPLATKVAATLRDAAGRSGGEVLAVVGFPSPIDDRRSAHHPIYDGYHLRQDLANEFSSALGTPVLLENDANLRALGFARREDCAAVIHLTIGRGIGAGLVVDNQLLRGDDGDAGEVGHINSPAAGVALCGCGARGCVVLIAGADAVLTEVGMSSIAALEAAAGSETIAAATASAAQHLAHSLAPIVTTLAPARICVSGSLPEAAPGYVDALRDALLPVLPPRRQQVAIFPARHNRSDGRSGALALASDWLLARSDEEILDWHVSAGADA